MAEVQGFKALLTLDGNDITAQVQSTPFTRSKGTLNKGVMDNSGQMQTLPGMQSGALRVSGWLSQAEWNAMEVTYAKEDPVTFTLVVDEGLLTDAGWSGLVSLATLEVDPQEDGLWAFNLDGETSGVTTYTPSAVV